MMAEPSTNRATTVAVPAHLQMPDLTPLLDKLSPGGSILAMLLAWFGALMFMRNRRSKSNVDVATDNATIKTLQGITTERDGAVKARDEAVTKLIADASKLGAYEAEIKALNREIDDLKKDVDHRDNRIKNLEQELIQCRAAEGRVRAEMKQLMEFMSAFLPKEAVDLMHAKVYEITDITKELLDDHGLFDRRTGARITGSGSTS